MKRDAATAELSRAQLEAEVAQLRSENAALRTVEPAPQSAAQPAVLGAAWGDPAGDPPAPPPSGQPAVLGAAWGGPAFDPLAPFLTHPYLTGNELCTPFKMALHPHQLAILKWSFRQIRALVGDHALAKHAELVSSFNKT